MLVIIFNFFTEMDTSNTLCKAMEKITLVIKLDEEDDDFEDQQMNDELQLREAALKEAIENHKKKVSPEIEAEMKRLDNIIEEAAKQVYSTDDIQKQYCRQLTQNIHKGDTIPANSSITKTNVLIPYYDSRVHFRSIKWVDTAEEEKDNIAATNPALWISKDYNPFLATLDADADLDEFVALKFSTWRDELSEKLESFVIPDSEFIIWEMSYLKDPVGGERGITGMTFIKCSQNDVVRVDDICNIKLSTNHRNTAQGDLVRFLNFKHVDIPIYIYAPERSAMYRAFVSDLFPWSGIIKMNKNRIYNLVRYLSLGKSQDHQETLKNLCFDKDIHAVACSTCNCINLLHKLCTKDYVVHKNPKIHHLMVQEYGRYSSYQTIYCRYVNFLNYNTRIGSILYTSCHCHDVSKKRRVMAHANNKRQCKN